MKSLPWFSLPLFAAVLFVSGCDKIPELINSNRNWLVGIWVLDREKTMEAFSRNNQRETPVGGVAGEIAAMAIKKSAEAMISPMDNAQFVFTDTEYVETFAGYTAKPKTYEIVSHPAPDQIKMVDSSNAVTIYHKEGKHIWYALRGNKQLQIYLKPSDQ